MSTRIGTIGGGKDPGEYKGAAIDDIVFTGVGFKTGGDKGFIGVGVKLLTRRDILGSTWKHSFPIEIMWARI